MTTGSLYIYIYNLTAIDTLCPTWHFRRTGNCRGGIAQTNFGPTWFFEGTDGLLITCRVGALTPLPTRPRQKTRPSLLSLADQQARETQESSLCFARASVIQHPGLATGEAHSRISQLQCHTTPPSLILNTSATAHDHPCAAGFRTRSVLMLLANEMPLGGGKAGTYVPTPTFPPYPG